eukprot:331667-Pelagomonas_calceolata.AAC.1
MLSPEIQESIHKLFNFMWATRLTPVSWKPSETILIDKNKGEETEAHWACKHALQTVDPNGH